MPAHASLEIIEDFLDRKRIAMVGISRDPKNFSGMLFAELCRRGYDVVPVNPNTPEVQGKRCFAHVQDIEPLVEAALLMTSPEVTEAVVRDCAAAGITRIWMYRAAGKGAVNSAAVQFCQDQGIAVVPGECPFMFFPKPGLHGIHGFVRKIMGNYPRRSGTGHTHAA